MTTLREYYQLLKAHDWYFAFSDDQSVYNKGAASLKHLKQTMEESPLHQILFHGFQEHYFSGMGFDTEQAPLPTEPIDETQSKETN